MSLSSLITNLINTLNTVDKDIQDQFQTLENDLNAVSQNLTSTIVNLPSAFIPPTASEKFFNSGLGDIVLTVSGTPLSIAKLYVLYKQHQENSQPQQPYDYNSITLDNTNAKIPEAFDVKEAYATLYNAQQNGYVSNLPNNSDFNKLFGIGYDPIASTFAVQYPASGLHPYLEVRLGFDHSKYNMDSYKIVLQFLRWNGKEFAQTDSVVEFVNAKVSAGLIEGVNTEVSVTGLPSAVDGEFLSFSAYLPPYLTVQMTERGWVHLTVYPVLLG